MNEERESIGRIEVAPEVIVTIARATTLDVEGVSRMASIPPEIANLFRRATRQDGVVLQLAEGRLAFEIYILVKPNVNVLQTSREVQTAVIEAMDKMVGVPVEAVNVHVEDVIYAQGEAV